MSDSAAPTPHRSTRSLSGTAVTALVVGAISVVLCAIPIINNFALVLAIVGVILSILALVFTAAKRHRRGRGLAVAGLVLSILAIVGVLVTQALYSAALDNAGKSVSKALSSVEASASKDAADANGDHTQDILGKQVKVDLGTYSFSEEYGMATDSVLPVQITNISSKSHSFSVQIESIDASGNRITDDTVYVNSLGAGQSTAENAFGGVAEVDQANQIKTGTFKIVKVSMY